MKSNKDHLEPNYIVGTLIGPAASRCYLVKLCFEDSTKAEACREALIDHLTLYEKPPIGTLKLSTAVGASAVCYVSFITSTNEWQNIGNGEASFLLSALQQKNAELTETTLQNIPRYFEYGLHLLRNRDIVSSYPEKFSPDIEKPQSGHATARLYFSTHTEALQFEKALNNRLIYNVYNRDTIYTATGPQYGYNFTSLPATLPALLSEEAQQSLDQLLSKQIESEASTRKTTTNRSPQSTPQPGQITPNVNEEKQEQTFVGELTHSQRPSTSFADRVQQTTSSRNLTGYDRQQTIEAIAHITRKEPEAIGNALRAVQQEKGGKDITVGTIRSTLGKLGTFNPIAQTLDVTNILNQEQQRSASTNR